MGSFIGDTQLVKPLSKKLKLHGFNNLTKTLSFNIYDVCYTQTDEQQRQYIEYIDEEYNAERLTSILTDVADIIGANILNIARQDYDPQGAHLNKRPLTVHTYPESHPHNGISSFRADIDVSTCGRISPLKALNYLIHSFESDIVILDYRVRGFTRDVNGGKHYIDHKINSIQNYIAKETRDRYQMIDVNVYQENIFHTKMMLKEFDLDNYLFGVTADEIPPDERRTIRRRLQKEMLEIFYGQNLTKMPKT